MDARKQSASLSRQPWRTTHDGRKLEFEVIQVEQDVIIGETERVQRDEIAQLEVTRVSPGRTFGAMGGGFLLFTAIIGFMLVAAASATILGSSAP